MRISRVKWVSLLLLVSACLPAFPYAQANAQTSAINVVSSSATTDFPSAISFDLVAAIDGEIESIDLVYQMASLETLELLPGTFEIDGDQVTAHAIADLEIAFVPVGIDLTFRWVVNFASGETIETDSTVETWLDDRFEWKLRVGDGVEVYGYEASDDFMDFMVETASEAVAAMTDLYQPETVLPIRIWVYDTGQDYAGTQATNSQEWSAGSAYPDLQVIHAVIPDGNDSEVLRIIPHEISHQILHMATMNPYNSPATWIDEGLAVHAQTGGEDYYDDVIKNAFEDGELLSMQGLISVFPYDPNDARLAYAQSYSMVGFIKHTWGEGVILDIVQAYAAGNSHDDVLKLALGVTLDELEIQWLDSLAETFGSFPGRVAA